MDLCLTIDRLLQDAYCVFMSTVVSSAFETAKLFNSHHELLMAIPESALVVDSSGLIVDSNIQLEKLFGYTQKELQGKRIELLIPQRVHTKHIKKREQYNKSPHNQIMGEDNYIYGLHKSGEEIPVEVRLGSHTTEDGVFVLALITDITQRYWAQEHLKERDERLGVILESTRTIPWSADPVTWDFTYVGPQAIEILGYPVEQWYEKDFWVNKIHPDDRDTAIQICADRSKTHNNFELEYRMITSKSDVIWFHDIVNVAYKNGKPYVLRGFLLDITDRKLDEQKLQEEKQFSENIIDSLPGLFFMLDRQGRYVRWNKKAEELHGRSGDKFKELTAMDLVSPEKRKEMLQNIETGFQEGQFSGEYEFVSKDGQKIEYAGHGIRTNIDGNDYLVGFEIDISKQKKMEKDTHRLRNELAHVNRLATMGELTASIAHELNQPLAAIMNNAQAALQFLKKEIPDVEEVYAALTDITSDDQRASEIIKRLRKFIVKGQSENVRLNIADHIEEVVKLIKNDANNKNISIVFENTLSMISLVMGDRIQLQQVVLNLILNAFDAMEEIENKSRKLVIRVIKNSDNRLTIEFIDNGIGFEQQDIERLFTAFSTTKQEGMGMGLTISRTIIEAHGGKLKAIKNDNGGATFYFDLPLASEISV